MQQSAPVCLHGQIGPCPYCEEVKLKKIPMSLERQGIVAYLEWAAGLELGNLLTPAERQGVKLAASWIKNRLDQNQKHRQG